MDRSIRWIEVDEACSERILALADGAARKSLTPANDIRTLARVLISGLRHGNSITVVLVKIITSLRIHETLRVRLAVRDPNGCENVLYDYVPFSTLCSGILQPAGLLEGFDGTDNLKRFLKGGWEVRFRATPTEE